jgi:hypothetical protein
MMRPPTQVCLFQSLRERLGDRKDLPIQLDLKTPTPFTEVLENRTRFFFSSLFSTGSSSATFAVILNSMPQMGGAMVTRTRMSVAALRP